MKCLNERQCEVSIALEGKINFFWTETDALRGLYAISGSLPTDAVSLFYIFC